MSNNAIVVKPTIQLFQSAENTTQTLDKIIVDSTEYDLNRTVARQQIATSDSSKLDIKGFNKLYFFETEDSLLDAAKQFSAHQDEIDISTFEPTTASKDKTLFALVFGQVGFQATDKFIPIANPVYRVYPSAKQGVYVDFIDIKEYIQNGWLDAFHRAITFNTPSDMAASGKPSQTQNLLAKGAAFGVFGALLLLLFGVGLSQAFAYFNKAPSTAPSYSTPTLTGMNVAAPAMDTPAQDLYESESDKLLARMNINLDENQNMGCFTK